MANDIDKTSPHYKGEFGSIYEVNQKFPNGGVAGDYVEIDGWAHYWNADRGTWCVNAQRDSYWDELLTNLTASLKLMRGASYMGMATPSTQPDDSLVKRFYFAKEAGTYSHFGNISVPQGISILYSSNGKQWILQNLLEISQGLGDSTTKVVSQKTLKDEIGKKADASELAKKANIESVDETIRQINGKFSTQEQKINKKANADEVNNVVRELRLKDSELVKKLDQKAEQSAVNAGMRQLSSEVARKADKETVNASLDLKANKRDVVKTNAAQDAEISRKANQQDVERSLNILRKEIGERTVVEGNVNNNPDEEDLTSKMGSNNREVLSLKDREYNPLEFSGKGYKILRKNILEVTCAITKIQVTKAPTTDGYVSFIVNGVETHVDLVASTDNTVALVAKKIADKLSETMNEYVTSVDGALVTCTRRFGGDVTASSFSGVSTGSEATVSESSKPELRNLLTPVMINQPNTIYEIRYDFDLNNTEITIPEGCILDFQGGNFSNGILHTDKTIVLGNPDSEIIGTIYDKDGIEISSKNKKKKCSAFNVCSSFSMFGDSLKMPNINDKRVFYRDTGMNKIWLCILLQYDDVNNKVFIPDWYDDYHKLGGLSGVVKYLRHNMGCETVCVKLHKNYNFKNTANEPNAYEEFCYKIIDEMKLINISTIFISNEEYSRIIPGSIWLECFKNIIQYAHSKDIKVGFSMNQWDKSIKNMDLELLNMIDKPYENFYPSLNWKDEKSSLSDLPMMINTVYTRLLKSKKILMDRKTNAEYGISECGIARCTKALRYPYEFNADNLGDKDTTGNIFDLFWRAILEGAEKAGVYNIANWYLDESESSDIKKDTINFIFCKVW